MREHSVLPTLAQARPWNFTVEVPRSLRKRWKTFEKDSEDG